MKAFADHGELDRAPLANGGDCEEVLARFADAGVGVDVLAAGQGKGDTSSESSTNELAESKQLRSGAMAEPAQ